MIALMLVFALHGPVIHQGSTAFHHHRPSVLRQPATSYTGGPGPSRPETICVPERDARPDAWTFTRPDLPGYLCREVWR